MPFGDKRTEDRKFEHRIKKAPSSMLYFSYTVILLQTMDNVKKDYKENETN